MTTYEIPQSVKDNAARRALSSQPRPCGDGIGNGLTCGATPARLFPTGWRCATHDPNPEQNQHRGQALRDQGVAQVDANTDPDWKALVDRVIAQLAATGQPFTADDVRAQGVPEPAQPQAWGSRFLAAARAGHIRRIGYQPSRRASVHAHPIAVWQGAAA